MDSITQAALGATIAQAAFGKKLGPTKAMLAGAVLGALPDLDILAGLFSSWASLEHHRGLTHSLLFAPVTAPLWGWLSWRWLDRSRPGRWRSWSQLAFWAVITHPLLDLFTSYGTQLLAPLSDRRFALDAIPIVDPIFSLTLIAALGTALWWRRRPRVGQVAAAAALVLTSGYLAAGWHQSQRAQQLAVEQLRAEGFEPTHVRAQPSMLIWLWRVVARDAQGNLRIGAVSTYKPTPMSFEALERPRHPLIDAALGSERGRRFEWFADGLIGVRLEPLAGGGQRVVLEDQRFGLITQPGRAFWGAWADFDQDGRLLAVERYRDRPTGALKEALGASWRMMWHGVPPATTAAGPAPRPGHAS